MTAICRATAAIISHSRMPSPLDGDKDIVLAYRVRIGMISRSSFVSVPPKPCRLHAPTTCLTAAPLHLCLLLTFAAPKWGVRERLPATVATLLSLTLRNLDNPTACIIRLSWPILTSPSLAIIA